MWGCGYLNGLAATIQGNLFQDCLCLKREYSKRHFFFFLDVNIWVGPSSSIAAVREKNCLLLFKVLSAGLRIKLT